MPRYMLDTDTCSYTMKRTREPLLRTLRSVPVTDVCMSVITKAELLYGVEVSPRRSSDAAALAAFLSVGARKIALGERWSAFWPS